jgi:hypothetical protein
MIHFRSFCYLDRRLSCAGMINWDDPDYKSAGNFAAYVSSIAIQCGDPSAPSANTTSYVYGSNSSTSTPQISFSGASTNLKDSKSGSSSSLASGIGLKVAIAVGGLIVLVILAMLVRSIMKKMGKKKGAIPPTSAAAFLGKQQSYQPLHGNASVESHGMQNRLYAGQNRY